MPLQHNQPRPRQPKQTSTPPQQIQLVAAGNLKQQRRRRTISLAAHSAPSNKKQPCRRSTINLAIAAEKNPRHRRRNLQEMNSLPPLLNQLAATFNQNPTPPHIQLHITVK
jgi:hypothetical protein